MSSFSTRWIPAKRAPAENNIKARVEWRIKRLYSIYQKLQKQKITVDQVYDLLAVRVITATVQDCYAPFGLIHSIWRPVPGGNQGLYRHAPAQSVINRCTPR